jgi:hypothetical protein
MSIPQSFHVENIAPQQLLTIGVNVLHQAFHDGPRLDAKRRYQFIMKQQPVFLLDMAMKGGGQLKVTLGLERSELRGQLNFSLFRQVVGQLLVNYTNVLNSGKPLNTFTDAESRRWVFLHPTFCKTELGLNALGLVADLSRIGELRLELMFVDPQQFLASEKNAAAAD